jgi:hypothetical protein
MTKAQAIKAIDEHGMLIVFPIDNRPEPKSLWSVFYPRSKMRWEWDDNGDNRVAGLWHLREELSRSKRVIYAKWHRGRATFFSRELFTALLSVYMRQPRFRSLSKDARQIIDLLEENSPQSTKQLKRQTSLVGRALEPAYVKAMEELWSRGLIVAFGEVDEGAFPSLAIGSTRLLFEDLYLAAQEMPSDEAQGILAHTFALSPVFEKQYNKILAKLTHAEA